VTLVDRLDYIPFKEAFCNMFVHVLTLRDGLLLCYMIHVYSGLNTFSACYGTMLAQTATGTARPSLRYEYLKVTRKSCKGEMIVVSLVTVTLGAKWALSVRGVKYITTLESQVP